ncbi:MAG: proline dehydrogenase family protein [Planctomycetes bacterium]|nr:proline dehydrogenase family protein [Planctomycetota bacterium]
MTIWTNGFNSRCRKLGEEILERARAARPRWWQAAWWQEQGTALTARDRRLEVQLFRFIEVLPALGSSADVARHLKEYLSEPNLNVPAPLRLATSFDNPKSWAARVVGRAARLGADAMARRFITGLDSAAAVDAVRRLRRRNMAFTLDVLGEATHSDSQADRYAETYLRLLETLSDASRNWRHRPLIDEGPDGPMPQVNLSIKLSSLEPRFNPVEPAATTERVCARLRPLLRRARELGAFVNVDMESYKVRDLTLHIFTTLLEEDEFRDMTDVGIVVQAYLKDGERDLARLLDWVKRRGHGIAIRLVKGAYWDNETTLAIQRNWPIPVWTRKWESDACFERMARVMLDHHHAIRPAFASHNVRSLACVMTYAQQLGLRASQYEIQMLHGMGDPLKTAVAEMGRCLRIYTPVGDLVPGMAYLIRRLLENSSNDSFLHQTFQEKASAERLLADPAVAQPVSAALPKPHYVDPFEDRPMRTFVNGSNTSFATEENRAKLGDAIRYVRGGFGRNVPLVVGGEVIQTESQTPSINPSRPDEVIGRVSMATTTHADRAVVAATKALPGWRQRSAAQRGSIVCKVGDLLDAHRFEFTALLILEAGKPWSEADGEVTEAIDYCRFYAEQIERLQQRPRRRNRPGEDNVVVYEPLGVCVVLSPWAFPLALLANMTTAALAAGNTVIMKPATRTPVVAARFMEILQEAGVPAGVVNYLPGSGTQIGRHLVEHSDVHVIAVTGSRSTGLDIIERAAVVRPRQGHIKKVVAHMGGKNAVIVDSDADIDEAVMGVLESAFACAGQKCSACSRAVVLEGIYDDFCHRLVEAAKTLAVGSAESPGTLVGPIIDRRAADSVRKYIEIGRQEGRMLLEMDPGDVSGGGIYIGPTIIADVPPDGQIAHHEIFGPVLAVCKVADFDEALTVANGTRYALTGGVYSRSPRNLQRARREFRVGTLYINRKITGSFVDVQPWGGTKLSGTGSQAGGEDFLLEFCQARTISENTVRHGFAPSDEIEVSAT